MENTRLDLAVLLYRDFNEDFSIVDDLDVAPPLPSLEEAETMASRSNPSLSAAIETLRASRIDVKIARQAFLPTLTLDAVYGIEANAFALNSTVASAKQDGPLPNLGYFITASLNVPVWDWGVRRSKLKQSELRHDEAEADLSAAQRALVRNLRGFYGEAQLAHDQIDLLRRAVDLASESLRLNTLRYQAGEAAIVDLVDAQAGAIQTQNAYYDGMSRYRLAVVNLQTITGTF
jgi:outer membrane protein TolC